MVVFSREWGAAAALALCCLVNADTQGTILAPARGMLLFVCVCRSYVGH